jgi:hypothetical protein
VAHANRRDRDKALQGDSLAQADLPALPVAVHIGVDARLAVGTAQTPPAPPSQDMGMGLRRQLQPIRRIEHPRQPGDRGTSSTAPIELPPAP